MTPREIAHATAMKWMPESAPDSVKVIALMVYIEGAIKTAIAIENEACAKVCEDMADANQDSRYDGCLNAADRIRERGTR